MKVIAIGAIVLLILMIGAPLVYASKADTEQEANIASDSKGRVCNFGPSHDECYDQFIKHASAQTNSEKHITEGVIIITYNVPKQGINLVYRYIDKAPGTGGGTIQANLTGADDGLFQWIEPTRDSDSPYHPGDKFTV